MTQKKILKGYSNFKHIVGNNGYFVDKTPLIKDFYENSDHVLLMPRPRRFGKTLNLSMVEYFFDIRKKEEAHLFEGLKISQESAFCKAHQNKYPVINISLKIVRGSSWEDCLEKLKTVMSRAFKEHRYLLKSDNLEDFEKQNIRNIMLQEGSKSDYENSLYDLSEYLTRHFGVEAVILVDEYDTPIIDGYKSGFYAEIIKFMQIFMGMAFKENDYLQKGLITGIMRIARESIFSEMNNVGVFTILDPFFADTFGFTESEVKEALEHFGLQDQFADVKEWYDGYQFGGIEDIYNPWSIVNYIVRNEQGFKSYWINTGTDALIKDRILEPDLDNTYNTLQKLIAGETIKRTLEESFVFPDFQTDRELLWTLLTFSGYLTQVKEVSRKVYSLRIPNYEIKTIFQDIVIKWLQNSLKIHRQTLLKTTEHLLNNRLKKFEVGLKKIMLDIFSSYDEDGEAEKVYQAYVLGLLAIIGDDYIIRSNRESGVGRYDILLIPYDKSRYGIVIEIKQIKRGKKETDKVFHKKINQTLEEAAQQIQQNKYYRELIAHRIQNRIELPIVFAQKEPYIFPIED